jgi:hypothetical protein
MLALDDVRRSLRLLALALVLATTGPIADARADPLMTWSQPFLLAPSTLPTAATSGYRLLSVSCAAPSLCVAVDDAGHAFATTDPAGGGDAWTVTTIDEGVPLNSVSCPSTSLCVAGGDDGKLLVSTNPGAPQPHWSVATTATRWVLAVSCRTITLCLAVAGFGDLLASSDPTGGPGAWRSTPIADALGPLWDVACASMSLCVTTNGAIVFVTQHPLGGMDAWTYSRLASTPPFWLTCPAASLCIGVDTQGNLSASTKPAAGGATWHTIGSVGQQGTTGISCPTADRCIIVNGTEAIRSDDPVTEVGGWVATHLGDDLALSDVSCASVTLCVAVDLGGHAVVGIGSPPIGVIDVTLAGAGEGRVVGTSLSCPAMCSASLPRGEHIVLTAIPRADSAFDGWGGACSGASPCELTVGARTPVRASFAALPRRLGFTLSVAVGGRGTVTGPGIACPPACRASHPAHMALPLRAHAARGWWLFGWGGACQGNARCALTADRDQVVWALFKPLSLTRMRIHVTLDARRASARLTFGTPQPRLRMHCSLTRLRRGRRAQPPPRLAPCRSPRSYAHLRPGRYLFSARAAVPGAALATKAFALR